MDGDGADTSGIESTASNSPASIGTGATGTSGPVTNDSLALGGVVIAGSSSRVTMEENSGDTRADGDKKHAL